MLSLLKPVFNNFLEDKDSHLTYVSSWQFCQECCGQESDDFLTVVFPLVFLGVSNMGCVNRNKIAANQM